MYGTAKMIKSQQGSLFKLKSQHIRNQECAKWIKMRIKDLLKISVLRLD